MTDTSTIPNTTIEPELALHLLSGDFPEINTALKDANSPRYKTREEILLMPIPQPLASPEALYSLITLQRKLTAKTLPFKTQTNLPLHYQLLPNHLEKIHIWDRLLAGTQFGKPLRLSDDSRLKYAQKRHADEAIALLSLEGPQLPPGLFKKSLSMNKKPKTHPEALAQNLTTQLQFVENTHLSITTPEELIALMKNLTGTKFKKPTKLRDLPKTQLANLINAIASPQSLAPNPILSAVIISALIQEIAPFEAHNKLLAGLLKNAILYRCGYWALSYLSITEPTKSRQLAHETTLTQMAETGDITPLIDLEITSMSISIGKTLDRLKNTETKAKVLTKIKDRHPHLNDRQILILQHFYAIKNDTLTLTEHQNKHEISRVTAGEDLKLLTKMDYLTPQKQGRYVLYTPTPKIQALF